MNIKDKLEQLDKLSDVIAWNESKVSDFKRQLSDTDPMSPINLFNFKPIRTYRLEIALKVRTRLQERWVRAVEDMEKHYNNLDK